MSNIKIGGLVGIAGLIVGGLIVAWAYGLDWLQGIGVVGILVLGLFVSILVAVFQPIGNMIVRVVVFAVVFALIVLFGLQWLGVV